MAASVRGHKALLGVFPAHTVWTCCRSKRCPQKGRGAAWVDRGAQQGEDLPLCQGSSSQPSGCHVVLCLGTGFLSTGGGRGLDHQSCLAGPQLAEPSSPWCGVNDDSGDRES